MRIQIGALLVALGAALATVTLAAAHAEPAVVSPGDGAVLNEPPLVIEIEMSQEMNRQPGANDIDVFDAAGNEVTTTAAAIDNGNRRKISVSMPSTLEPGVYTIRWKTLSADDGDPDSGELSFTYDPDATPDPGKTQLREDLLNPTPTAAPGNGSVVPPVTVGGERESTSWILVTAVAVGMFVLGGGTTFLLVQKRG